MTVLAFTAVELRRLLRDRTALFFMVLLPTVIILVIGATVGGAGDLRIGIVATDPTGLAADLVDELHATGGVEVRDLDNETRARDELRRGELDAVVVVPVDLDTTVRAGVGAAIPVLATGSPSVQQAARSTVAGAVARHASRLLAAGVAAEHLGADLDSQLALADATQAVLPEITVRTESVDGGTNTLPAGFGTSAPTMLVLFVFINSLAGGAAIIQARRLGVYQRALAAPVRTAHVVLGETLAYAVIGLVQSALIVTIGAVLFSVDWGDPVAAAALICVWVLVGTGTGVLAGTLFRTPEQASAIGPAVGIAFGMLGGAMWPLEIVPPVMRTIGHAVPHAWAVDAWVELLSRGGGIADIGGRLAVLGGFAVVLLTVAAVRLGRRLD